MVQESQCLTSGQLKILTFAARISAENEAKEPGGLRPLTRDMAAAVHAYTQESPFYLKLNLNLRSRARGELKPFFPYLKLFLAALNQLKPEKCTLYVFVRAGVMPDNCVSLLCAPRCWLMALRSPRTCRFRGVKLDLTATFTKGKTFVWWSITSATTNASILESEQFLGKKPKRERGGEKKS